MTVKKHIHDAFIATVKEVCITQEVSFSMRPSKSGYMIQAGDMTMSWHRSRSPWDNRNFRRLGLNPDLIRFQP